jgi:hypothetical protein
LFSMILARQISTLFLSLGILVSSIGIPVNRHFCMNRLTDVKLFTEARKCVYEMMMDKTECPSGSMPVKQSNGCCKDTHEFVKIDYAQDHIQKVELGKILPEYISIFHFPVAIIELMPATYQKVTYHQPPQITRPTKRVEFHSFLI